MILFCISNLRQFFQELFYNGWYFIENLTENGIKSASLFIFLNLAFSPCCVMSKSVGFCWCLSIFWSSFSWCWFSLVLLSLFKGGSNRPLKWLIHISTSWFTSCSEDVQQRVFQWSQKELECMDSSVKLHCLQILSFSFLFLSDALVSSMCLTVLEV